MATEKCIYGNKEQRIKIKKADLACIILEWKLHNWLVVSTEEFYSVIMTDV